MDEFSDLDKAMEEINDSIVGMSAEAAKPSTSGSADELSDDDTDSEDEDEEGKDPWVGVNFMPLSPVVPPFFIYSIVSCTTCCQSTFYCLRSAITLSYFNQFQNFLHYWNALCMPCVLVPSERNDHLPIRSYCSHVQKNRHTRGHKVTHLVNEIVILS